MIYCGKCNDTGMKSVGEVMKEVVPCDCMYGDMIKDVGTIKNLAVLLKLWEGAVDKFYRYSADSIVQIIAVVKHTELGNYLIVYRDHETRKIYAKPIGEMTNLLVAEYSGAYTAFGLYERIEDILTEGYRDDFEVWKLPERMYYRHYKGSAYEMIALAEYTESRIDLVIYTSLDTKLNWARPVDMFFETFELEPGTMVKRFEKIDEVN